MKSTFPLLLGCMTLALPALGLDQEISLISEEVYQQEKLEERARAEAELERKHVHVETPVKIVSQTEAEKKEIEEELKVLKAKQLEIAELKKMQEIEEKKAIAQMGPEENAKLEAQNLAFEKEQKDKQSKTEILANTERSRAEWKARAPKTSAHKKSIAKSEQKSPAIGKAKGGLRPRF